MIFPKLTRQPKLCGLMLYHTDFYYRNALLSVGLKPSPIDPAIILALEELHKKILIIHIDSRPVMLPRPCGQLVQSVRFPLQVVPQPFVKGKSC